MSIPNPNTYISLTHFDPAKYGWTIGGGVDDVLSPYERARRREAKRAAKSKEKHKLAAESSATCVVVGKTLGDAPRELSASVKDTSESIEEVIETNDTNVNECKHLKQVLDLDSYHMGLVGSEKRDPLSFELIDENEPQDMNHHWDPKTFVTNIKIRFPLNDIVDDLDDSSVEVNDPEQDNNETNVNDHQPKMKKVRLDNKESTSSEIDTPLSDTLIERKENENRTIESNTTDCVPKGKSKQNKKRIQHYFEEEIRWNFANPSMPTPAEYVMNIASDFGLSWETSIELQDSIQKQLQAYVKANIFMPCVTLRDAAGKKRDVSVLYAQAERERAQAQHIMQDTSSTSNRVASGSGKKNTFDVVAFDPEVDHIYLTEVKERLKSASLTRNINVLKNKSFSEQTSQRGLPRLQLIENEICHVCRVSKPKLVRFSCNLLSHNFCEFHCKQRLGIILNHLSLGGDGNYDLLDVNSQTEENGEQGFTQNVEAMILSTPDYETKVRQAMTGESKQSIRAGAETKAPKLPSNTQASTIEQDSFKFISYYSKICPICSLICECNKCSRRMEKIAKELKLRCIDLTDRNPSYNEDPISSIKLDVWSLAVGPNECGSRESFSSSKRRRSSELNSEKALAKPKEVVKSPAPQKEKSLKELMSGITLTTVPKVDVSLIPYEVPYGWSNGVCEMGAENLLKGDGNVDYCLKCLAAGNLICCDKCPRSFHKNCVGMVDSNALESSNENWICPRCIHDKDEKNDSKDNSLIVTGKSYLENIKKTFAMMVSSSSLDEKYIIILAKLCELLSSLIEFDFGYIFREPVDLPDYSKIIERPMDLGTIRFNLLNGKYADLVRTRDLEDAPTMTGLQKATSLVLLDIEQIWQNCYVYNMEGSAVYRMADVQRLQYNRIRRMSFENDLSPEIKSIVKSFIDKAEGKRKQISASSTLIPYANRLPNFIKIAKDDVLTPQPGCSFIERKNTTLQAASKSVIVIDPDSNTIVRYYSTQRFAMQASSRLLKSGHDPGLSPYTDHFWRKMIRAAALDPTVTVFGYRWLIFDDVLDRMTIFPGFIDKIEKPSATKEHKNINAAHANLIMKKDTLSGAILEKFLSIQDAYQDWFSTIDSSLSLLDASCSLEKKDLITFEKRFLEGENHVDGIRWIFENPKVKQKNSVEKVGRSSRTISSVQASVEKQKIKEIEKKEKKEKQKADFIASIPSPRDDHCHAFIRPGRKYCKRKVVPGGNYCVIHMKQLLQDNNLSASVIAMSEVRGTLPPERKRYGKQAHGDNLSGNKVNSISRMGPIFQSQVQQVQTDSSDINHKSSLMNASNNIDMGTFKPKNSRTLDGGINTPTPLLIDMNQSKTSDTCNASVIKVTNGNNEVSDRTVIPSDQGGIYKTLPTPVRLDISAPQSVLPGGYGYTINPTNSHSVASTEKPTLYRNGITMQPHQVPVTLTNIPNSMSVSQSIAKNMTGVQMNHFVNTYRNGRNEVNESASLTKTNLLQETVSSLSQTKPNTNSTDSQSYTK